MRRLSLLPALLLLTSPVLAGDLTGLWQVQGKLPTGVAYEATAAISPAGDNRYKIAGRGRLADGRTLTWRARGVRKSDDRMEVRHTGRRGLVGRILAGATPADPPSLVGLYAIDADEQGFGGRFSFENSAQAGEVRYTRLELPTVTFTPTRFTLRTGDTREVRFTSDPASALGLITVEADEVSRVYWDGDVRVVEVEGKDVGSHRLHARLGAAGGPHVGVFRLRTRPPLLQAIVDTVKEKVAAGEAPIVVFDLDDTLFDTRYRVRDILRDYGEDIDEDRLRSLSVRHVRYELPKTLENAGFSEAEITGPTGTAIRRYWSRRFFHGDSYELDRPIRGAVRYVEKLVDAGARIIYVTGRRVRWKAASLEVLAEAGYPSEEIYCKPNNVAGQPSESTEEFKERIAKDVISPMGPVVAAYDNEPGNANAFNRALPDATIFWLDTLYKPDSPALEAGIHRIRNFR